MLSLKNTVLIIVDVQGKLARLMHDKEALYRNLQRIIEGAQVLELPILRAEQNPQGLGPTIPEIDRLLPDSPPISKLSFSCCGSQHFVDALEVLGRKQVLIAGIETHVCVYQTAADLLDRGYEVHAVSDAVSSRTAENRRIGLEKIRAMGGSLTGVEMALFELLRAGEGEKFRRILKIVR